MPGKNCDGKPDDRTDLPRSRLYCDGFYARALDAAATNPYDQTENPEDYAVYQRGIDYAASLAGQVVSREQCGCCAGSGLGPIPI